MKKIERHSIIFMGENHEFCFSNDVDELEKQNEELIEIHRKNYNDILRINKVMSEIGMPTFDIMEKETKNILESQTGKPIEEVLSE